MRLRSHLTQKDSFERLRERHGEIVIWLTYQLRKGRCRGQAISTDYRLDSRFRNGFRNAADAQSLLDTAEGALQETSSVLLRMRELAGSIRKWYSH